MRYQSRRSVLIGVGCSDRIIIPVRSCVDSETIFFCAVVPFDVWHGFALTTVRQSPRARQHGNGSTFSSLPSRLWNDQRYTSFIMTVDFCDYFWVNIFLLSIVSRFISIRRVYSYPRPSSPSVGFHGSGHDILVRFTFNLHCKRAFIRTHTRTRTHTLHRHTYSIVICFL